QVPLLPLQVPAGVGDDHAAPARKRGGHMTFISRAQVLSGLVAVLLALLVLELVRRRKLSEEYSVMWLASMTAVALAAFATPLLRWVARAFGMLYAASTVFLFGIRFVVHVRP